MTTQVPSQAPSDDRIGPSKTTERVGGAILALTGVLMLGLILNHPTVAGHQAVQALAVSIGRVAAVDRLVHGMLMAIIGLQAVGFYVFAARLGLRGPAVAAGLMAFTAGAVVMVIPATLDGFVIPDVASACLKLAGGCGAADVGALRLISAMIQDFTKVALILMSAASAAWGAALAVRRGWLTRIAGVVGLACAVVPAWVLLTAVVNLRPGNLAQIIAAQVVWALVAAGVLLFGARRAA
jgi:hypothetical protein